MTILLFGVNQNTKTVFFYLRGKEDSCRGVELDPAGGMRSLFVIYLPWYILRCIAIPSDFNCQFTDTFPESFFISPQVWVSSSNICFCLSWLHGVFLVLQCCSGIIRNHQKCLEAVLLVYLAFFNQDFTIQL